MKKEELEESLRTTLKNVELRKTCVNEWLANGNQMKKRLAKAKRKSFTFQAIPKAEFEGLINYLYWQTIYSFCRDIVDGAEKLMSTCDKIYDSGDKVDPEIYNRVYQTYHVEAKDALHLERYVKATKLHGIGEDN